MTKVIDIAKGFVGVKESPPGSNKVLFNEWFYGNKTYSQLAAWCGTFVSYCFAQAGYPLGIIDYLKGFAGCQYAVDHLSKWGRIVTIPKPGDVVFFDWNGDGHYDHTGIFIEDLGKGLFRSIEGNTSLGNNSDGGEVMIRSDRKYKPAIFIRPKAIELAV